MLIDAPDFTERVARKVRDEVPDVPIVKVVAPTVWAWRPGRAAALAPIVDEVLAIFPHEPAVMAEHGGPRTTYIGHPLTAAIRPGPRQREEGPTRLLVLPGSRSKEIERLAGPFGQTVAALRKRVSDLEVSVVTPPAKRERVERAVAEWTQAPRLVSDEAGKIAAFQNADMALAASGTVTLELALHGVPTVAAYKLDILERQVARAMLRTWAIAMPNIIADYLVMPEVVNDLVRPERMARMLERLIGDTPERAAQVEGFETVRRRLATDRPAARIAAGRILAVAERR